MSRKNKNAGGRRHDTRMNFKQISRALGLSPRQRIIMYRTFKKLKGGGHKDN